MITFLKQNWGDLSSATGLVVSFIGFVVTVVGVIKAKNASEQARDAANQVRERFRQIDGVTSLAEVLAVLAEIKRLHRADAWHIALDRYPIARRLLNAALLNLFDDDIRNREVWSKTIHQLLILEQKVERSVATKAPMPSIANANSVLSPLEDELGEIMAHLKRDMETGNG